MTGAIIEENELLKITLERLYLGMDHKVRDTETERQRKTWKVTLPEK